MAEIFEDQLELINNPKAQDQFMTDEQIKRGQYYLQEYLLRKAEMGDYIEEWNKLWKLYQCDRDRAAGDDGTGPNSFVPIVTPCIEGQAAAMIESDVEFNYVSNNPGHEQYMQSLNAASEYNRRRNQFMRFAKDMTREYLVQGNAIISPAWEKDFRKQKNRPKGYASVSVPSIQTVFFDGKIKDPKDIQKCEYIIHEIGSMSRRWAIDRYGEDKANAISYGSINQEGENPDQSFDDWNAFDLLHVWTRNNEEENLQLIEMDTNGFILKESDPSKPYYPDVDNEYPFYLVRGIPQQGKFYGMGDGKILMRFQETINCLTDEMEVGAKFSSQGKIYVDEAADMDDSQLNNDPSKPVICNNPNQNIRVVQGQGVNSVIFQMVQYLLEQAQAATRFGDIMNGIAKGSSATATQINGQLTQGSVGIRDKKADISAALAWADRYCLKLCLANWDKSFWSQVGEDYQYVDPVALNRVPATIPLTTATAAQMRENPLFDVSKMPKYETVEDDDGQQIMEALDFDVKVILGTGVPKGKNDLYNMVLALMQIQVIDPETGAPTAFLETKRARQLMEEAIGRKMTSDPDAQQKLDASPIALQGLPGQLNPVGNNDTVQMPTGAQGAMSAGQMANVAGLPQMDLRGTVI